MPFTREYRAAKRCLASGLSSLSEREERFLCRTFRKEVRKGAFVPAGGDILADFCRHVLSEFGPRQQDLVVYDFMPYWRRHAASRSRVKKVVPLAPLVLYATWIEHWLNMMITVAMLRQRKAEAEISAFFANRPTMETKVKLIGPALGLPQLPRKSKDAILQISKTRNRYVHYSWRGAPRTRVKNDHAGIRALVRRCPDVLNELGSFEDTALDTSYRALITRLFPRAA